MSGGVTPSPSPIALFNRSAKKPTARPQWHFRPSALRRRRKRKARGVKVEFVREDAPPPRPSQFTRSTTEPPATDDHGTLLLKMLLADLSEVFCQMCCCGGQGGDREEDTMSKMQERQKRADEPILGKVWCRTETSSQSTASSSRGAAHEVML